MPVFDLSTLDWSLTGWRPFAWKLRKSAETGGFLSPDHGPFPGRLPGSVQENLRRAGAIPDWHIGRNSLAIEWVEHRHWMFAANLPPLDLAGIEGLVFRADGLDAAGWVMVNGVVVGEWAGAHLPVQIELGTALAGAGPHELAIVFDLPPEGQGQMGYTSRARELKPRYNFGWDWCARVVPIGAAGRLALADKRGAWLRRLSVGANLAADLRRGSVELAFDLGAEESAFEVEAELRFEGHIVASQRAQVSSGGQRLALAVSNPTLWWPQGEGAPALYQLEITVSCGGRTVESETRAVGFKHIEWRACVGALPDALPWLCVVNGRPIFLQGVNWTPVRMGYRIRPLPRWSGWSAFTGICAATCCACGAAARWKRRSFMPRATAPGCSCGRSFRFRLRAWIAACRTTRPLGPRCAKSRAILSVRADITPAC